MLRRPSKYLVRVFHAISTGYPGGCQPQMICIQSRVYSLATHTLRFPWSTGLTPSADAYLPAGVSQGHAFTFEQLVNLLGLVVYSVQYYPTPPRGGLFLVSWFPVNLWG